MQNLAREVLQILDFQHRQQQPEVFEVRQWRGAVLPGTRAAVVVGASAYQ